MHGADLHAGALRRAVWPPVAVGEARAVRSNRVLLLGLGRELAAAAKADLKDLGLQSVAICPGVALLREATVLRRLGFDIALVNLDAFDTLDAAVDALIGFRKACPDISVIALSQRVAADDTGSERAAICDATLRLPVSLRRLRDGIMAALENLAVPAGKG